MTLVENSPIFYTLRLLNGSGVSGRGSTVDFTKVTSSGGYKMGSVDTPVVEEAVIPASESPDAQGFHREAIACIEAVQKSLADMLASSGKSILKTRDVEKYFGVDSRLSWQIYKLLNAKDLLGAGQYVPPGVSFQKLANAARTRGIKNRLIVVAQEAFERFETFIELHAADRTRFESMVTTPENGKESYQTAIQHRKAAFRANAFFWGAEVKTMYAVGIVGPSRDHPGKSDVVYIVNLIEFNRLRPNVNTHVAGLHYFNSECGSIQGEGLDMDALHQHGAPVLPHFSTKAIPHLETHTDQKGVDWMRLAGKSVGLVNSVDIAFGEVGRGILVKQHNNLACAIVRPTQQLYLEMFMHHDLFSAIHVGASSYGQVSVKSDPSEHTNPDWKLPCYESALHVRANDDHNIADIPHRQKLLEYACAKMNWAMKDFEVYRLHAEYPMLDTATVLELTSAEAI